MKKRNIEVEHATETKKIDIFSESYLVVSSEAISSILKHSNFGKKHLNQRCEGNQPNDERQTEVRLLIQKRLSLPSLGIRFRGISYCLRPKPLTSRRQPNDWVLAFS